MFIPHGGVWEDYQSTRGNWRYDIRSNLVYHKCWYERPCQLLLYMYTYVNSGKEFHPVCLTYLLCTTAVIFNRYIWNMLLKSGAMDSESIVKARCLKPPGHCLYTPEPGRPDCVVSIPVGVNGDEYPVAVSQKVTKNLPVSFYSPMPGFKADMNSYKPLETAAIFFF